MSFFVLTVTEASLDWLPSFVAGVPLCAIRTAGCHLRRRGRRFRLDDAGGPGLDSRRRHANPGEKATSPIGTTPLLSTQLSSGLSGAGDAVSGWTNGKHPSKCIHCSLSAAACRTATVTRSRAVVRKRHCCQYRATSIWPAGSRSTKFPSAVWRSDTMPQPRPRLMARTNSPDPGTWCRGGSRRRPAITPIRSRSSAQLALRNSLGREQQSGFHFCVGDNAEALKAASLTGRRALHRHVPGICPASMTSQIRPIPAEANHLEDCHRPGGQESDGPAAR